MGGSGSFVAHGCFPIFGPIVLGGTFWKLTNLPIFVPLVYNFHSRLTKLAWVDSQMSLNDHMAPRLKKKKNKCNDRMFCFVASSRTCGVHWLMIITHFMYLDPIVPSFVSLSTRLFIFFFFLNFLERMW